MRLDATRVLSLRDDDPVVHDSQNEENSLQPPANVINVPPPAEGYVHCDKMALLCIAFGMLLRIHESKHMRQTCWTLQLKTEGMLP